MAMWETEDELSAAAAASLPTPSDTPYRTPSRTSKRSRRSVTPPGLASSSPAPLPGDRADRGGKRSSKDISNDESISILDPRRFTPTLHANLVSEILTLRRDQEDKLKIIESLETSLHTSREEQEVVQANNLNVAKENRSLKRQLALLEGGTSSALSELARERDEAVETAGDTKRRLDTAQKKARGQEEDSQRVHDLWAKEKDEWEEERRKYERKLHVADTRLKAILDEVATIQAAQANGHAGESEADELPKDDGASIRTMSITNSIRFSVMPNKVNGHSLADELNFDDDEYQTDPDGRDSVMSNARHIRNQSRDSIMSKSPTKTHRRNQSSESQMRAGSVARGRLFINQSVLDRLEGGIREDDETQSAPKPVYKDAGIQYSPPPSPKLLPSKPSTPEPTLRLDKPFEIESPPRGDSEIEANQRRKRVHINRPVPLDTSPEPKSMVSTSSQTNARPLSPPTTPDTSTVPEPAREAENKRAVTSTTSSATQTDPPPVPPQPLQAPAAQAMLIPSISIHPPTSRPPTPREHRLPQYVKDFGCQVSLNQRTESTSSAVQTDEIRVDTRLDKLPPHLHPSAISSRPVSPNVSPAAFDEDRKEFTPLPGNLPPRNPRRLAGNRSPGNELPSSPPESPIHDEQAETRDYYPPGNDDGALSSRKAPMRRPPRLSSLFAGFEGASSDEVDEFGDGDLSDLEYRTALSAPRPKASTGRHTKRSSAATSSTIEHSEQPMKQARSSVKSIGTEVYSSFSLAGERESITGKPPLKLRSASDKMGGSSVASRVSAIRKSALIQSGIASHQGRARSPSLPDAHDPPFPIPTRASSRKPVTSASAPSDGQRSPTRMSESSWHRRGLKTGPYRSNSIRKVRSATALARNQRGRRQGSRSPPPFSPSEEVPESPSLPPLPTNDLTSPRFRDHGAPRYKGHRSQPSTTTANTDGTNMGSVNSSPQASGVVDAIAQTMVGEWMFKYVRRKSFGGSEAKADESSNDRHKRWVWLAPYERSILWSSKQPSSGSALMGKSGRKLTIQSVLDVKDDNPAPKGSGPIFNRSILILTPQRALKFTATTAERHYLWLTSLSFLAHSSQAVPEILGSSASAAPPLPKGTSTFEVPPPPPPPPASRGKKSGIRDSIRLTKGKNPMLARPEMPAIPTSQLEEALTFKPETFAPVPNHQREVSREVAEPPYIPRYHERQGERVHERANQVVLHGRKRSNTGGHVPPPLSFRGFSGPASQGGYHTASNSTAGNSVGTAGSSDVYTQGSSVGNQTWGMSTTGSVRTSEASSRPGAGGNFFEAIGTVRMEAFISPLSFPRFDEDPNENEELRYRARRRSKEMRRRRSRSRHRDSYNSRTTRGTDDWYGGSRTGGEEDYFRDDPFKGF